MHTSTIFTIIAALTVSTLATPATSLTRRAADYSNNCKGSGFCGTKSIRADCGKAIATVNAAASYTDQAQFSVGDCYSITLLLIGLSHSVIYATNGAGDQPVSGQTIIDTANTILDTCTYGCGSYGTNNVGCSSCHVTLNYRAD
ncbi:hypothetical protein ONZ51_g7839 [Trametes cubensis]|uniref:Uncharacterized protein n=1 Tax=Trametes cubensis TaxID=1111947 RepID=A0AAD7X8S6_9APHY|nr:hypothetical protein ONZ51_g7839 [Trametes cubensis]